MIPWSYEDTTVVSHPDGAKAFVYELVFESGLRYIGKKNLESVRKKKVTGKTRKVITRSESNWKAYLSSSTEVKAMIKAGNKLVERKIIRWCYSVGEASYWEAYYQFLNHVLHSDAWLNKWISVRLYKQKLKEE